MVVSAIFRPYFGVSGYNFTSYMLGFSWVSGVRENLKGVLQMHIFRVLSLFLTMAVFGVGLFGRLFADNKQYVSVGSRIRLSTEELIDAKVLTQSLNNPAMDNEQSCQSLAEYGASLSLNKQKLIRTIILSAENNDDYDDLLIESKKRKLVVDRIQADWSSGSPVIKDLTFPILTGAVEAADGKCPLDEPINSRH